MARETRASAPRHVARALMTCAGLALCIAVFVGGVVRCPTALLFGVPCPSCGTTRAVRALFELEVAHAFRIHPVAPFVLAVLVALTVRTVRLVWREGNARGLLEGKVGRGLAVALVVLAAAELVVWGLRWGGLLGGPVPV